jgi:hypothetical protein
VMPSIFVTVTDFNGLGVTNCQFSEGDILDAAPAFSSNSYNVDVQAASGTLVVFTNSFDGTCYLPGVIQYNTNNNLVYPVSLGFQNCLIWLTVLDPQGNPLSWPFITIYPDPPGALFLEEPTGWAPAPQVYQIVVEVGNAYTVYADGGDAYNDASTITGFLENPGRYNFTIQLQTITESGTGTGTWFG